MKINFNQRHAVLAGASLALLLGTAFGSVLRPNCDAAEYSAGPRLEMGRAMSEGPVQEAASTLPYQQAATDPAPINLTDQPAPTVKPLRQARLAPVQLADNTSDEDISGTSRFNDDAPAGAPAKAEQADVSGVDGPESPATENPPT